jgi:hypothetical protein
MMMMLAWCCQTLLPRDGGGGRVVSQTQERIGALEAKIDKLVACLDFHHTSPERVISQ